MSERAEDLTEDYIDNRDDREIDDRIDRETESGENGSGSKSVGVGS